MGLKNTFEKLTGLAFPPNLNELMMEQLAHERRMDEIRHERRLKQEQLFADAAAGRTENVRRISIRALPVRTRTRLCALPLWRAELKPQ
jgi:hypothetical protein